jgi:hypothetical protein
MRERHLPNQMKPNAEREVGEFVVVGGEMEYLYHVITTMMIMEDTTIREPTSLVSSSTRLPSNLKREWSLTTRTLTTRQSAAIVIEKSDNKIVTKRNELVIK